jgi:hypothetical protein
MTNSYPEPPHLSVFVQPGLEQQAALLAAWDVLSVSDCVFTGDVLVARDKEWFRDVSDVEREMVRHEGSPRELMANHAPLRILFRHRTLGLVSLGLSSATEFGEPHPLEVAVHAGPLSLPAQLWTRHDRQAAKRLLGRMERLLRALAEPTRALYGAIGVESVFPSPAALAEARRSASRPTTWFWSSSLSEAVAAREGDVVSSLSADAVTRTREGTLFRAWRPGWGRGVDEPGIQRVLDFLSRAVEAAR